MVVPNVRHWTQNEGVRMLGGNQDIQIEVTGGFDLDSRVRIRFQEAFYVRSYGLIRVRESLRRFAFDPECVVEERCAKDRDGPRGQ